MLSLKGMGEYFTVRPVARFDGLNVTGILFSIVLYKYEAKE